MKKALIIITILLWIGVILFAHSVYNLANHSPIENKLLEHNFEKNLIENSEEYEKVFLLNKSDEYELNIYDFRDKLSITYYFLVDDLSHPCQFYSAIWSDYLEYNNIDYKFISTDNHVFVIAYDDEGYYILDQLRIERINLVT